MKKFSISRAWIETRERLARDGKLYVSVALALLVLPQTIAGLVAPPQPGVEQETGALLIGLVAAIIGVIGQLALVRLATGSGTSVGQAIAHGARRLGPALLALILFALAVTLVALPVIAAVALASGLDLSAAANSATPSPALGLAILLLIVLALGLSVRMMMMIPVASAEAVGPIGILKRSWALTRGQYWRLLAFLVLILIAALTLLGAAQLIGGIIGRLTGGAEPLSVGALLAAGIAAVAQGAFTVVTSVMLARMYLQLAGAGAAEASVPTSGT